MSKTASLMLKIQSLRDRLAISDDKVKELLKVISRANSTVKRRDKHIRSLEDQIRDIKRNYQCQN